jgi:hypothetical protein
MEILACIPELPCQASSAATVVFESPRPSKAPAAKRGAPRRFPPPSIIALVAVAAVVWAAAWRNDRLRLEEARQQRPERLAQELPATAGAARSVTP